MDRETEGRETAGSGGSPAGGVARGKKKRGMHGCLIAFLVVMGTLVLSVGAIAGLVLSIPGLLAPNWTPQAVETGTDLNLLLQQKLFSQFEPAARQAMTQGQATLEVALTQEELNGLLAGLLRQGGGQGGPGGLPLEAADVELVPGRLGARFILRTPPGPVFLISNRRIGLRVWIQPALVGESLQLRIERIKLGRLSIPAATVMTLLKERMPFPPQSGITLVPEQAVLAYGLKPMKMPEVPLEMSFHSIKVEQGRLVATLLMKRTAAMKK
ncbi:MAG: hypothetical protein K6T75_02490 [Acetobacteraceae bacterium]|nr:hypothetical protein [Acetobacteraceae bacterium]